MSARRHIFVCCAICVLAGGHRAYAQNAAPTDGEIAAAIARGVDFLKETQAPDGHWDEPSQNGHRLGMTALAGLALLENGIAPAAPEIVRARTVVERLAHESNQTYDLALAILFLARLDQGRRGEADRLIQTLGRRIEAGSHQGVWDYTVPRDAAEPDSDSSRKGRRARRESGRRVQFSSGQGDNSNTQFALLGLWAAGRHGFDSDSALESIDQHFRSSQLGDGRWGYRVGLGGSEAMSCAGLDGAGDRGIAAQPRRAADRARGAALAADQAFVEAAEAPSARMRAAPA